jgi:hypothetical protein
MSRFQNFAARAAKKQVRSAWPFARTGVLVHKNSLASNLNCFVISRIWKTHSDFKWSRHRLAHVFADGWSTASHKRKRTLLEEPTGTLLFYYKYIKQEIVLKHEIVHTLLLEELGVSKKWVIIMERRQDSNVTSCPTGKSGPPAQDCYCAGGLGRGAKNNPGNGENRDKSSNCDSYVTCVDVRCFLWTILQLNWCCAICISRGWFDKEFVIWHFLN